jgi:uncharacterized protein Yka (UPF0111/DUF47 family)
MKIMTGTKRETTISEWMETLDKYMNRANDSMECFRLFKQADDLTNLIEDCQKLLENAKNAKKAIEFMDNHGVK